ncbi:hypothetical protein AM1_G0125 (plasmid) [Acaryochloris marina MBIC11017]|uniref:Uncharacterized protein n=1 Tax=Acaryochloris marina (strain MBIC 11017) TaxID=329726 RepID=A8ZQL9_ACAM1|nr:hypothetical protein AM1_G0125 [Acaryochloris marina MBIC11017]
MKNTKNSQIASLILANYGIDKLYHPELTHRRGTQVKKK